MKRVLLLLLTVLGYILNTTAQLAVLENGQTQIGNCKLNESVFKNATLNIWGLNSSYAPSISFGAEDNSMISGDGLEGILIIKASKYFALGLDNNILGLSYTDKSKLFDFTYNVKAPSFLTPSDIRYKTNISSLEKSYLNLLNINPISYRLVYPLKTDLLKKEDKTKSIETYSDERIHYGFIAQEIKEIFPELVVQDEDDILSIDYIGFIPLLVDAYKKLHEKVTEQGNIIISLVNTYNPTTQPSEEKNRIMNNVILNQNYPNPFNTITEIACYLPYDIISANLCIYDLRGSQILEIKIHERGNIKINVESHSLKPGIYLYGIIADGIASDSKRMIVTN